MYDNRFFIWADHSTAKTPAPASAGGHICIHTPPRPSPYGHARITASRPLCNWLCPVIATRCQWSNPMDTGSSFTTRKRFYLRTRISWVWHGASCFAGQCQSSPRCVVGYGRRGKLCGPVSRCGRNTRRPCSSGFHRDQTFGDACGRFRRSDLPDPQWRSRCVKFCARTMARGILAIAIPPARRPIPRLASMGCGFISCPRPHTRAMGGPI